jgi:hypothetical protein
LRNARSVSVFALNFASGLWAKSRICRPSAAVTALARSSWERVADLDEAGREGAVVVDDLLVDPEDIHPRPIRLFPPLHSHE